MAGPEFIASGMVDCLVRGMVSGMVESAGTGYSVDQILWGDNTAVLWEDMSPALWDLIP